MRTLKIGIVGSRSRDELEDLKQLGEFIEKLLNANTSYYITFVSGGCPKGGDRFAEVLATQFGIPIHIYYPNKSLLPAEPKTKDFRKINYDRNTKIAMDADILVAVVASDRKGGTEDTIRKFKKYHPSGQLYILN